MQYEFLGPIRLSEWGPPMEKTVYLIMARDADKFRIVYAGDCKETKDIDFFTGNEKFKCWIKNAGREDDLWLSILPMFKADEHDRSRVIDRIISGYVPDCNGAD